MTDLANVSHADAVDLEPFELRLVHSRAIGTAISQIVKHGTVKQVSIL